MGPGFSFGVVGILAVQVAAGGLGFYFGGKANSSRPQELSGVSLFDVVAAICMAEMSCVHPS